MASLRPRGASVQKCIMWVDGKAIPGELVEAAKAKQIYTDIVQRTQDPGLLEYIGTKEAQQLNSDFGGLRSVRPDVTEKSTRTPLSKINTIVSDPADVRDAVETIKQKY